jgi:hypothetical protein
MALTPEQLQKMKESMDALKASMRESYEIQQKLNKGLGGYAEILTNIGERQKNINYIESQLNKELEKRNQIAKQLQDEEARIQSKVQRTEAIIKTSTGARKKQAEELLKRLKKQTDELRAQLAVQDALIDSTNDYIKTQKESLELTKKAVKESNLLLATVKS